MTATAPGLANHWLSGHIHFDRNPYGAAGDKLVLDLIDPFTREALAANWIDRFFFIRYTQDGPHLRLRLHGDPDVLANVVAPALAMRAGDALRWVPYEPEIERYGGPDAIHVAEALFCESSVVAIDLIRAIQGNHSARLGKGLLATLVLMHVFTGRRETAIHYARSYTTSYLYKFAREEQPEEQWSSAFDSGFERQSAALTPIVLDAWDRLVERESLTPTLDAYRRAVEHARDSLSSLSRHARVATKAGPVSSLAQAALSIGTSYLHMMNNRLGVPVPEEAYLAHLIGRAFATPVLETAQ